MAVRTSLIAAAAVACALLATRPVHAQQFNEPMTFRVVGSGGNCNGCSWIAATGEIVADTPKAFAEFLRTHDIYKGMTVELHSPGGGVAAGFELGDMIREHGLNTDVGRFDPMTDPQAPAWMGTSAPGDCWSACTYVFLAGVSRSLDAKDRLGFHQFHNPVAQDAASAASDAQVVAAVAADYLVRMGIDARVLALNGFTGPDDLYYPTPAELIAYRVVTVEGFGPWELHPSGGELAASTVSNATGSDERQISVYCRIADRQAALAIMLDGPPSYTGQPSRPVTDAEAQAQVVEFNDARVTMDGRAYRFDPRRILFDIQGEGPAYVYMPLTARDLQRLLTAGSLAVDIDASHVFSNFGIHASVAIDDDGRAKLRLAARGCL